MFYYKTINEDISDGMIEDNAKIWCMFCNTDVSKALDDAIKQTEEKAVEEIKDIVGTSEEESPQQDDGSDSSEVDESMLNERGMPQRGPNGRFLPKAGSGPKSAPKPAPKPPAPKPKAPKPGPKPAPKTPKPGPKPGAPKPGPKKPGSSPTPEPSTPKTPAPEPGAPKKSVFGKAKDIIDGTGKRIRGAVETTKNAVVIGGTGYLLKKGSEGVGYARDYVNGKGNKDNIKKNPDGSLDKDSWNSGSLLDQQAAVDTGDVDLDKDLTLSEKWWYKFKARRASKGWPVENIALAVAAAWGLWKSRNYIWSRVKELADWLSSGKSLAVCEFKSDGDTYKAEFDIKAKKWKLYYADSTITKEQSYPPKEVADKFFSTKFFDKLTKACWKQTDKYLNDKTFAIIASTACSTKGISSSSKSALKDIFKDRKQILKNLKDGKYEYI